MINDKGRPVIMTFTDREGQQQKDQKGTFKVWAYKTKTCGESKAVMMESKAIVEDESGFCRWVNPANLQFTDRNQNVE